MCKAVMPVAYATMHVPLCLPVSLVCQERGEKHGNRVALRDFISSEAQFPVSPRMHLQSQAFIADLL